MQTLPDLYPGKLYLALVARPLRRPIANTAIARLALRGPVRVLDGGNRFDAHGVSRALRLRTHRLKAALERIQLSRAFTCYQMLTLLSEAPPAAAPTLALDLLATFYDESVSLPERLRLLEACLQELRRLSRRAVVLAIVSPSRRDIVPSSGWDMVALNPPGQEDPLLERLESAADQMMRFELEEPKLPLRLF